MIASFFKLKIAAFILLPLAFLHASPSMAAEWWAVRNFGEMNGTPPHRTMWFVDQSSIRPQGTMVLASVTMFMETADESGVSYTTSLTRFDCAKRTYANLRYNHYSWDGKALGGSDHPAVEQKQKPVPPRTAADGVLQFACGDRTGAHKVPDYMAMNAYVDFMFDPPE